MNLVPGALYKIPKEIFFSNATLRIKKHLCVLQGDDKYFIMMFLNQTSEIKKTGVLGNEYKKFTYKFLWLNEVTFYSLEWEDGNKTNPITRDRKKFESSLIKL